MEGGKVSAIARHAFRHHRASAKPPKVLGDRLENKWRHACTHTHMCRVIQGETCVWPAFYPCTQQHDTCTLGSAKSAEWFESTSRTTHVSRASTGLNPPKNTHRRHRQYESSQVSCCTLAGMCHSSSGRRTPICCCTPSRLGHACICAHPHTPTHTQQITSKKRSIRELACVLLQATHPDRRRKNKFHTPKAVTYHEPTVM